MSEELILDILLNIDINNSEYILSLPKDKQRLYILSLIDKQRKGDVELLWSELPLNVSKMQHILYVIKVIEKFIEDAKIEKKKYGEVMTPIILVREMLDTLPVEVWSNPDLKWLDPANGAGTFPFVVIYKLMNGLSEWEKNDEKRYKHIVENMIYTCELQSRNVFLWLCGVDTKDEYTTNSYWGSFLDEGFDKHMKDVWNVDKFDIVVGNPPYSDNSFSGKNNKIYPHFSKKCLNLLKYDGKMLFITPVSATKNNQRFSLIGLNGLSIVDFTSNKYFNDVGVDICYWYVDRNEKSDELLVITDNGKYCDKINNQVFDTSKLDRNILDIIEGIKEITLKDISKRMFRQNNFQPDVTKDKNDIYVNTLYEKIDKIYGYIKAVPYHFNKNKIIIPFSKKLKGNIFNTKKDFNQNWLCLDINNDIEFDNIKSFILSEHFINFVSVWKKMDGYGFSNAIKYLPKFDKLKRWDNEKVKLFLESFKK